MEKIILEQYKSQTSMTLDEIVKQGAVKMLREQMSPTVFRIKGYRFYFLSNEEERMHVHVENEKGEAKFWLEPIVSLAVYYRLNSSELNVIQKILEKRKDEVIKEWKKHFRKH